MSKFRDEFDDLSGFGKFLVLLIVLVIWLLLVYPMMWLWNYVMPGLMVIDGQAVFQQLDYWHTAALDVLFTMLFIHRVSK